MSSKCFGCKRERSTNLVTLMEFCTECCRAYKSDTIQSKTFKDLYEQEPYTPNFYQRQAMRTCNIPDDKKDDMLHHAVWGLNSEAGEAAGIFQKMYQEHPFDKEHLIKELGDALWMIAEACTALDITLEDCMKTNIEKLRKRYPDGFEAERSLHRAEGDV